MNWYGSVYYRVNDVEKKGSKCSQCVFSVFIARCGVFFSGASSFLFDLQDERLFLWVDTHYLSPFQTGSANYDVYSLVNFCECSYTNNKKCDQISLSSTVEWLADIWYQIVIEWWRRNYCDLVFSPWIPIV